MQKCILVTRKNTIVAQLQKLKTPKHTDITDY